MLYVFVSPNINEKAEKASRTAAANYALPYQNPVLIICKCHTSVNQLSLIFEEKVLICGKRRQGKILLTYAQPQESDWLILSKRSEEITQCPQRQHLWYLPCKPKSIGSIQAWKDKNVTKFIFLCEYLPHWLSTPEGHFSSPSKSCPMSLQCS